MPSDGDDSRQEIKYDGEDEGDEAEKAAEKETEDVINHP